MKKRYALGFKFGKLEHKTRYFGIKVLIIGAITLCAGYYFKNDLCILSGIVITVFVTVVELISLVFHFLEKKTMDKIRFGKNR